MHVDAVISALEELAPPSLAEEFDEGKIGLIVEGRPGIGKIACALDATRAVVDRAVASGADMLVVHHTPLWKPVTALTGETAALLRTVLSAEMNVYVMHTNFDRAPSGVNDALAELLGLTGVTPMSLGCIGSCAIPVEEIGRRLGSPLRIWGELAGTRRLAVVGGSGFDLPFLHEAKALGADAFLSAEMKHSVARAAPLPCIEATHYSLEAPAMRRLALRSGWEYIDDPPALRTLP